MIGLISLLKEMQGKPKAIFMAGPAGSGKSYISQKLVPSNFNTINVDDTYEELLKASGIGMIGDTVYLQESMFTIMVKEIQLEGRNL